MKIIYLHQYFQTPCVAGATRSYEMARRLVRAGHQVHMVTTYRGLDRGPLGSWFQTQEAGIRVHWLVLPYSNKMPYARRLRVFLRFAWSCARRAADLGGDLIFATSTPLTIALPAVYAAKKNRIPMVFEVRDLWPDVPIALGILKGPLQIAAARRLERFAYRNAARVVALSPGMKAGVVAAGYPPERVTIIPNSSDIELFDVPRSQGEQFLASHPYLKTGPLITYAGTLGLVNGVDYLVEIAAAMLRIDPAVRFLILGEGNQEEVVRRRAEQLGVLGRNTWLLPPCPKHEMPKVLSATTVATSLVRDLPALWHNSANKVFDAFAARRPVMINHEGWQADLLRKYQAGLVVPPRNAALAARMLHQFVSDKRRLARAGEAAGYLADTMFNRDMLAEKLRRLLEQVLAEHRRFATDGVSSPMRADCVRGG